MGVCEGRTNKNKVQWKQGTKAREQGNKGKQGTRAKGNRPGKVYFFTTNFKTQKKMKKSEKDSVLHNYNLIISFLRNMKFSYCIILKDTEDKDESLKIQYLINELEQQIKNATFEMTEFISINYINGDK